MTSRKILLAIMLGLVEPAFATGQPEAETDYLSLANGAVPVAIGGQGATLGASFEQALQAIDGNPGGFSLSRKFGGVDTDFEFVYALPAATTFTGFSVPNVLETPSPSQTFARRVEIHGSAISASEGYALLASAELSTHKKKGERSGLSVEQSTPIRWVKLRLVGGIEVQRDKMFYEFSEIIGTGIQEAVPLSNAFTGIWKGRGVLVELKQAGATVSGCYDKTGDLTGTVTGNVLRATGIGRDDGSLSTFLLTVLPDKKLLGVRSSNGAPFKMYTGPTAPAGTKTECSEQPKRMLGCGSVVHGIQFEFDSAKLRGESEPVLKDLLAGLKAEQAAGISIEGHTSSEGPDTYNQKLSERRAQAVVDWLVAKGIASSRLTAAGKGEAEPIAKNVDEAGRSLNRRVEIVCR